MRTVRSSPLAYALRRGGPWAVLAMVAALCSPGGHALARVDDAPLRWESRFRVASGWAEPTDATVAGGVAVVVGTVLDREFWPVVRAHEVRSGVLLWSHRRTEPGCYEAYSPRRPRVVADGVRVVVATDCRDGVIVAAHGVADGTLLWQVREVAARGDVTWGVELIRAAGALVVATRTAGGASVTVRDPDDGGLLWHERGDGSGTVLEQQLAVHRDRLLVASLVDRAGTRQIDVRAHGLHDGRLLWQTSVGPADSSAVHAVAAGRGGVFLAIESLAEDWSRAGSLLALSLEGGAQRWARAFPAGDFRPTRLLLARGRLYAASADMDDGPPALTAMDAATGDTLLRSGMQASSPIASVRGLWARDGELLLTYYRHGEVDVIGIRGARIRDGALLWEVTAAGLGCCDPARAASVEDRTLVVAGPLLAEDGSGERIWAVRAIGF